MKRKAFGLLSIFLVIFQMFSPWMITLSEKGISAEKNVAEAKTTRTAIKAANSNAFFIVTDLVDNSSITVSSFTDPSYKITSLKLDFIDESTGTETGCPGTNKTLVSVSSLPAAKASKFTGVSATNVEARGYLKQDFQFPISNFKADCITGSNSLSANEWGHYRFSYNTIDTNNKTESKTEDTGTGEPIEEIADNILTDFEGVVYIKAVKPTSSGNNFNVEWGRIGNADFIQNSAPGDLEITGKSDTTISGDPSKTKKTNLKIKFLQDGVERNLYVISMADSIDVSATPPQADKKYTLSTSFGHGPGFVSSDAQMFFDPAVVGGTQVTWTYLNSSTKQNISMVFKNADYAMQDYQIKKLLPATKDGNPVLDIDVSMLIDRTESKVFVPWKDNGDGKASTGDTPGDDWDNFTKDFGSPEIDRRSAEEGNGFYLLYSDTNKSPEIGDSDVKEVNLNEYIFGEKVSSPIITKGLTGMVFGLEPLPVEKNKTYYFRLYAKEHDKFFDDDGYTSVVSVPIPDTINQVSRGGAELIEEGNVAGGEVEEAWLPICGVDWPMLDNGGSLSGCLIQIFYYLVFVPTSFLLGVAGTVLDFVLAYSIQPDAYKAQYIIDGWRFIRDVCNLFFIFMMIYLAFKMMLGSGHSTKKAIVNTIIIATVINFSYPLTTVVIDASNIAARQLYYNAFSKTENDGKAVSLSSAAAKGFSPQKIILDGLRSNGKTDEAVNENKGTVFIILLVGVVFNIIAMLVFLKLALQFIYRIIGLIFAIILSPLALFSFSLSEEQRGKLKLVGFDSWMSGLLTDAFKAPVFLFLVMILVLFVNNNPFNAVFGSDVNGLEWWASLIVPFMLIIAFFKIIEGVTKSMTSSLAEMTGGALIKGAGALIGIAAGGAALAGGGLLGKGATRLANSSTGQRIFDRAATSTGLNGFIARQQAKALRAMQTGSYDIRQNSVANAVSKESGANFNLGASAIGLGTAVTAGGYMSAVERRNKKRDEFRAMLEWNKALAGELEEKKKKLEDEKVKKGEKVLDQKNFIDEREKATRESEKAKKEADERVTDFEKLEDLLAKRNDATSSVPPKSTTEIDVQIGRIEAKVTKGVGGLIATNPMTGAKTKTTGVNGFGDQKMTADADKVRASRAKELNQERLDVAKQNLTKTNEGIRQLDKDMVSLTKAIEKVKKDRVNGFNHRIRNKSGYIFNKKTYGSEAAASPEKEAEHARLFGSMADQMRNIITSVDEHSHTVNDDFNRRVRVTGTALGALTGAFTGGVGAIAGGAVVGGIVGMARSYRPDNEHYGVAHDPADWHPHAHDNYHPPTGGGGGGASHGGGDHGGGHH